MPTPRIEPISVCELDTGRPTYHVPRFQITPASKQRQHHDERRAGARIDEQIDRQQVDDAERDRGAAEQHAEEVHEARSR